jgi:hypothetical protein
MRAPRIQVVALLILALMFGAVQCVASCVSESPSTGVPPCHRHTVPSHAVAADCAHDFLLPDVQTSSLAHIATNAFAAPAVQCAQVYTVSEIFTAADFSPPEPANILRV